jgi:predicted nuclease of restriction endonuclease-like (RecB) superfamily
MAAQVFKDSYVFDSLGTNDRRQEREVELALIKEIQLVANQKELGYGG